MTHDTHNTPLDEVAELEVKAIAWLERASEEGDASRGFVGELVLSIINEGREEGDDAETTLAIVDEALTALGAAASTFKVPTRQEIAEA